MSTIVCDRRRRRGGTEGVPLLGQEGWTRHQENAAKPPLKARPGWSVRRKRRRAGLTTPSAPLRNGIFFLMAQPPLLFQEGNTLASATRSCDGGAGISALCQGQNPSRHSITCRWRSLG